MISKQGNQSTEEEHQAPMGMPRPWLWLAGLGVLAMGAVLACPAVRERASETAAPKTPAQSVGPLEELSPRTQVGSPGTELEFAL